MGSMKPNKKAPKKAQPKTTPTSPRGETPAEVMLTFTVKLSEEAAQDVDNISDAATRAVLVKRAGQLREEPLKQGKPLTEDLLGYRSVRAGGQRYRLVYRVFEQGGQVVVVVVGIRKNGDKKDVYNIASKRLGKR